MTLMPPVLQSRCSLPALETPDGSFSSPPQYPGQAGQTKPVLSGPKHTSRYRRFFPKGLPHCRPAYPRNMSRKIRFCCPPSSYGSGCHPQTPRGSRSPASHNASRISSHGPRYRCSLNTVPSRDRWTSGNPRCLRFRKCSHFRQIPEFLIRNLLHRRAGSYPRCRDP